MTLIVTVFQHPVINLLSAFNICYLLFSSADDSLNTVHGLIWANLAFIAALIFHAGVSVNRIKTVENKVLVLENERIAAQLAGLKIKLDLVYETIMERQRERQREHDQDERGHQ